MTSTQRAVVASDPADTAAALFAPDETPHREGDDAAGDHPAQRDAALPLWQQIEASLLKDIRAGNLSEGDKLPSAFDLAKRFGVNRHTVRRAIEALEERGFLRTETGRGSFVQEHPYHYPIGRRTRFGKAMHDLNVESRYRLIEAGIQTPPRQVSRSLGLISGERVHRIVYSSEVEGRTVDHSEAWFPASRFPGLDRVFAEQLSVTRTLAEFGVRDYLRKHTSVMARLPGAEVARVLGQSTRRPVLCVHSLNVDTQGVPVQFGVTSFAGDWVQLMVMTDS
ncbi:MULTISPECIES: phosphonate metabolism transcriptional regulator PhnF [unclassified Lysobacter]|uniref:phosphonate metabolism transcriptional regulator PhnF n=1 Tax=unclassified Lysobacter TaxID=2635362 RepID=UPI001BE6F8A5|nr:MULTISPECIES: phosphonate metabolism transcriptional regulator PhnF [unclassified Lysobacter]MBT2749330.1 phosphonate metabolism transcriptional regulator PhnF [Lysobacter sp. ISL-42]MBT2750895.1 phosphonate metabolism transcriptional regulator PhnF [Lysobacter sp. ISL-50]MBT2777962.1 phosphonate metabolism transcriptional regulator PhnF [Lysobacter sp. ISL-54]MBT2783980.1 phosphonate metabolism transcriptional regulator PhnF [Lysobacter sp. ISL-52]